MDQTNQSQEMEPSPSCYVDLPSMTEHIRILHLLPASSEDDPIECTLEVVALSDDPNYEALSYVWGDKDNYGHQILLNGVVKGIRQNLSDALHALRFNRTAERILWIDALCINQDDPQERGHQVKLMKEIYSRTVGVLSWLNDPRRTYTIATPPIDVHHDDIASQEELADAIEIIKQVADQNQTVTAHSLGTIERLEEVHHRFMNGSQSQRHWPNVYKLMNNPYWRRVWIFQEVLLPKRGQILASHHSCSWAALMEVHRVVSVLKVSCSEYYPPLSSSHFGKYLHSTTPLYNFWSALASRLIDLLAERDQERHETDTLTQEEQATRLINHFKSSKDCFCSDPKDKVYGLLGLTRPAFSENIVVDYACSLLDLYEDVMRSFVDTYPSSKMVVCLSELLQQSLCTLGNTDTKIHPIFPTSNLKLRPTFMLDLVGRVDDVVWGDICEPRGHTAEPVDVAEPTDGVGYLDPKMIARPSFLSAEKSPTYIDSECQSAMSMISTELVNTDLRSFTLLVNNPLGIGMQRRQWGVAPLTVCKGDLLCRFSHSNIFLALATIAENQSYRITGRVVIRSMPTSPWKSDSWLPQIWTRRDTFHDSHLQSSPPFAGDWLHSDLHLGREVRISVSIQDLMLLTCPLKVQMLSHERTLLKMYSPISID